MKKIISIILTIVLLIQCFGVITLAGKPDFDSEVTIQQSDESPHPLYEIPEKRENNVKHFRMSDGSFQAATYQSNVHYLLNGEWKDIDNRFVSASDSEIGEVYENKSNSVKIKFAKKSKNNNLIKLQKDKYKLKFSLLGDVVKNIPAKTSETADDNNPATVEKTLSSVMYNGIFDGVDIEYVTAGDTLKENIIINNKLENYSFSYEIKTSNLTLALENNALCAIDGDKVIFYVPAPFMYDADGEYSENVSYSLSQQSDNKYIFTVTADADWVNTHKLPVTVDPTVYVPEGVNSESFKMATLSSSSVFHLSENVSWMNNALRSGSANSRSLYLKFSLPDIDLTLMTPDYEQQDSGIKIIGATMSLCADRTVYLGTPSDDACYSVHRNTGTWFNNFIYTNRPNHSDEVESYIDVTDMGDYCTLSADITTLVNDWYVNGYTNNGLFITPSLPSLNGTDIGYRIYGYDPYAFPALIVSYISSMGLEDYFSYTATDVDGLASAYVNNLTGSLNLLFGDSDSNNPRNSASIYHVYNDEMMMYDHPMYTNTSNSVGNGFKLNIQQQAVKTFYYAGTETVSETVDGEVIYTVNDVYIDCWVHFDADGTLHYYLWDENENAFINQEGLGSKLRELNSSGGYADSNVNCEIEFKSGEKYRFFEQVLCEIEDIDFNK